MYLFNYFLFIYIYIYISIYIYSYIYIYIYIISYTLIYIYVYIHIHIYLYTCISQYYTILYYYSGKPSLNKNNVCEVTTSKCAHPTGIKYPLTF